MEFKKPGENNDLIQKIKRSRSDVKKRKPVSQNQRSVKSQENVQIGKKFQANIPDFIPENERDNDNYIDKSELMWDSKDDVPATKLDLSRRLATSELTIPDHIDFKNGTKPVKVDKMSFDKSNEINVKSQQKKLNEQKRVKNTKNNIKHNVKVCKKDVLDKESSSSAEMQKLIKILDTNKMTKQEIDNNDENPIVPTHYYNPKFTKEEQLIYSLYCKKYENNFGQIYELLGKRLTKFKLGSWELKAMKKEEVMKSRKRRHLSISNNSKSGKVNRLILKNATKGKLEIVTNNKTAKLELKELDTSGTISNGSIHDVTASENDIVNVDQGEATLKLNRPNSTYVKQKGAKRLKSGNSLSDGSEPHYSNTTPRNCGISTSEVSDTYRGPGRKRKLQQTKRKII